MVSCILLRFSYDFFLWQVQWPRYKHPMCWWEHFAVLSLYSFWWMKSCDGHVVNIRTNNNKYPIRKNRWHSPQSSSFDFTTVQVHGIMKTCENSMNIYMIITKCIVDLSLKLSKQWSNVNAKKKNGKYKYVRENKWR